VAAGRLQLEENYMTVSELLELIDQYKEDGCLDLDTEIIVEVFHDDDTSESYPCTMATGHVEYKNLTLFARGDDPERN
jgi:hypothetical protein